MGDFSESSALDLSFSPSGIYDKSTKTFSLRFVFTASQGDENKTIVKIVCLATFEFNEPLDIDAIPDYFYPNSLAIVFPYVRAFVSSVTLQANMVAPILIPTLNLTRLQSSLKANTISRQNIVSVLYQTLEDRDNVDYVEANGPFPGDVRDRWLGKGYYYWDTFIDAAHYWGYVSYKIKGKGYIIAKSEVSIPADKLLNLLEPEQLAMFTNWRDCYAKTFPETEVTVEKVLTPAEKIMGSAFPYIAIKAEFRESFINKGYQDRIYPRVNSNGKAYLDLKPPVQICIKDKSIIGSDNFKVIYPLKYAEEGAYTF